MLDAEKGKRKSSGREGQSGTRSFSLSATARLLVRSRHLPGSPSPFPRRGGPSAARRWGAARGAGGRGRRLPDSPAVGTATSPPKTLVRGPVFRRPLPGSRSVRSAPRNCGCGKPAESGRRPGFRRRAARRPRMLTCRLPRKRWRGPTGAGAALPGSPEGDVAAVGPRAAWAS